MVIVFRRILIRLRAILFFGVCVCVLNSHVIIIFSVLGCETIVNSPVSYIYDRKKEKHMHFIRKKGTKKKQATNYCFQFHFVSVFANAFFPLFPSNSQYIERERKAGDAIYIIKNVCYWSLCRSFSLTLLHCSRYHQPQFHKIHWGA